MNFVISDLLPVLPEVFVLTMACVILIADLLIRQNDRLVTYLLVQLTKTAWYMPFIRCSWTI